MSRRRVAGSRRATGAPFLHRIETLPAKIERGKHPFSIRAFAQGIDLRFRSRVTFFVGENGSGKSTLLEAIAECCGFNPEGAAATIIGRCSKTGRRWRRPSGCRGLRRSPRASSCARRASTTSRPTSRRCRTRRYGGRSLHEQSHGESFMALFAHRFEQGIYILDEPEAALSPQRQLTFLRIIHELTAPGHAQFLIATHSPIVLSYPGAVLFDLDGDVIQEIDYRDTTHYQITRGFLNSPERFLKHLFATGEDPESE